MNGISHPSALNRLMQGLVKAYRLGISPLMTPSCRFVPTCSEYALEAYQTRTFGSASLLLAKRLCRCHPWGGSGFDPLPEIQASKHSHLSITQTP